MKEIHLGRILSENRRRKGITQDELAEFMGVSKAAVSKWETESTYPDILLLPRLAAYFDMSIDGKGPEQIARILEEKQILTAKALYAKRKNKPMP